MARILIGSAEKFQLLRAMGMRVGEWFPGQASLESAGFTERKVIRWPAQRVDGKLADVCAPLHPNGATGLGPAFNNKPLPVFLMKFQVRHGFGTMPSFDDSKISDRDLDALMTYVVALRRNRPERDVTRAQ